MKFLVSAGEASSDLYGAQLIVALRRRSRADDEPLEFMGVGGDAMRAAGCETAIDARELAVVGMTEIVRHLPRIYSRFRKLLPNDYRTATAVEAVASGDGEPMQ